MVRYCCICKVEQGMNPNISFHSIPKKDEMKAKWIINIGREVKKTSLVCSRHFYEKDFHFKIVGDNVKRILAATAVPSFELINGNYSDKISINKTNSTSKSISSNCIESNEVDNLSKIYIDESNSLQPSTSQNLEINDNEDIDKEIIEKKDPLLFDYEKDEISADSEYDDDNDNETLISNRDKPDKLNKNVSHPRYIGDLHREHFTSDISWRIVHKYIQNSRRKQKALNDRVERLNNELETLKSILDYIKNLKQNALEVNSEI